MQITLQQLVELFQHTKSTQLSKYVDPLNKTFTQFSINSNLRARAFLAQVGFECEEFNVFEENLNYSADALVKIFPTHFNSVSAKQYARKPEMIANRVYANRMGNGPESSGDGWKFRGRGGIQLTGKNNYQSFADYMEMSLDDTVSFLETSEGEMIVSGWFWNTNNLSKWADIQDMLTITRLINGGSNGYAGRMALYNKAKTVIS